MREEATHPKHYVSQSIMVEPIDILRFARFDLGNCLKYLIRAGHKDDKELDLEKAKVYLQFVWESFAIDGSDYMKWWERYGAIVWKFKVFEGLGSVPNDFSGFLGVLLGVIERELLTK